MGSLNLPNKLTLARMGMVPVFIILMVFSNVLCLIAALLIFIIATITDYYDGKIARERNLVTNFGKLLDPVADKILITAAFIMLMEMRNDLWIPGWTIVVIVGREFLITGARSLAATEGSVIGANKWGKAKALIQMIYIYSAMGLVIVKRILEWGVPGVVAYYGKALIYTSLAGAIFVALFTVYSGFQFACINWKTLNLNDST